MKRLNQRPVALCLILLVVASACAAVAWAPLGYYMLPDPATADREGLFHWLVSCELSEEPVATRDALRRRLEEELDLGISVSELDSASAEQSVVLSNNIDLLLKEWFHEQAAEYHATESSDRLEFIRQLLSRIESWNIATLSEVLNQQGTSDEAGADQNASVSKNELLQLKARVDHWIQSAHPDDQSQLKALSNAITRQVAMRALFGSPTQTM